MHRRAFLALATGASTAGCVGFFGPRESSSGADGEPPDDSTGYDDDADPGFDGKPLRVVAFSVPAEHDSGSPLPVSAMILNESDRAHEASVTIAERALDSGELIDSLEFAGSVDAGAALTIDVKLAPPPRAGQYRVTLGDPDAPAAAKEVRVE